MCLASKHTCSISPLHNFSIWSILGILGPFAFSVFLFCHTFGRRDSLKKAGNSRRNHGGDLAWSIWISRLDSFPVHSVEWRGLPFTPVKTCLKFWGFPWKLVWKLWGFPWKLVGNFGGSRNYFGSDLLRPQLHQITGLYSGLFKILTSLCEFWLH